MNARVVQLARMSPSQGEGRGFESRLSLHEQSQIPYNTNNLNKDLNLCIINQVNLKTARCENIAKTSNRSFKINTIFYCIFNNVLSSYR